MSAEATLPKQHQSRTPGIESEMRPRPDSESREHRPSGKLKDKVALITGGDSGIGRAVAYAFAAEGADVAFVYLDEHSDAEETRDHVEGLGRRCEKIAGDLTDPAFCREVVERTVAAFGRIDVLVNHAGEQYHSHDFTEIPDEEMEHVFRTNVLAMMWVAKAAIPHIPDGGAIINTSSVTAYRGSPHLVDYSATKGAVVAFTRSLATNLYKQGRKIRVNAVAPGAVWTPLIASSYPPDEVETFGSSSAMGRPAQPHEIAPCYVFLANNADSGFMTGQVLHPNGGEMTES